MRSVFVFVFVLLVGGCGNEEAEPPSYSHAYPDESMNETCVLCHACGTDGIVTETAPVPGQNHAVCDDCHDTDPVTHNCEGTNCDWQKSCGDPPFANCSQCHAIGTPVKTITQINDACRRCHAKESP